MVEIEWAQMQRTPIAMGLVKIAIICIKFQVGVREFESGENSIAQIIFACEIRRN